ncbi:MAG: class II fructose-1,6-bisphosphate aldolase [Nanoarchaeota archaeon]
MLISGKKILAAAHKSEYAIGHFNFINMEVLQAIAEAAEEERSPVFISTTEGAIKYAGTRYLYALAQAAAKEHPKVPIALHLDHGKDMAIIKSCIDSGWTSVMFDGSSLPFEENIAKTKEVVKLCRWNGINVEAELGVLSGVEDDVSSEVSKYTDPSQAETFVKQTGCHSLAVAIGTSHGAYKFKGKSALDITRLQEIRKRVNIPLVLHGASGVYPDIVALAKKYGAKLTGASGVSDDMIRQAVAAGIRKINCDTDLRLSFITGVRQTLQEKPGDVDLRPFLGNGRTLVKEMVQRKIRVFGSNNKF